MISEQAKKGFSQIFKQAATANLVTTPSDSIVIEQLPEKGIIKTPEKQIVVLTVASYTFRLLTIFHVGEDPDTVDYFSRGDPSRPFKEVFGEIGNLCCGAINRQLGKYFPHTGMSTPSFLESRCLAFLSEIKPTWLKQYRITIKDTLVMHATLCLCAHAAVDFTADAGNEAEATGELELF